MTNQDHARLLGIFMLIWGGLQALIGVFIIAVYGGLGSVFLLGGGRDDEQLMGGIFLVAAVIIAAFLIPFAVLYFYSGWKLMKHRPHSKVWVIIASIFSLLNVPIGTALGVYGLWFVFGDEGNAYYEGGSHGSSPSPPPPSGWR